MVRSCNGCTLFSDLYILSFVAITCFFHSHFRSLLDSFLCRQDILVLSTMFWGACAACWNYIFWDIATHRINALLVPKIYSIILGSCFGKFSLLCFNSCCACLLTSGFSFALVGKSRTILRITIQKCTGKFQCTGGSTVLALHFDPLRSFSIVFWWVRAICTTFGDLSVQKIKT